MSAAAKTVTAANPATVAAASGTGLAPGIAAAVADPARITTRAIDRVAYASDASHFLLTPSAVVTAADTAEVAAILRAASAAGAPVTFRSGGTSLSGQASTDGILVDTRKSFRRIDVLDGGTRVRAQPGATVRAVNAKLARHGHRLGPDPASEVACTIGGVVANNSSGMACGIVENTYRTLESMIFVLASGTIVDTADPGANAHLRDAEPELFDGLERLRRRVLSDPESVATIRRQFSMKNTMGYAVNAFLDFETPVDMLAHLIIGSEGTLAFVAEATYVTVPLKSKIATTLAVFPTLDDAARALPALVETRATTLELMDAASLRVGQNLADAPPQILGFEVGAEAALLIEYQAEEQDALDELVRPGARLLAQLALRSPAVLSQDAAQRALAWKLRKGLYTSVAGARPSGTTALLEDIVVPVPSLAPTCESLQELFAQYGYGDSVIFGHAKDGNIHFMLTDRFEGDAAMGRFTGFTEAMVDLVLGAGGNLKAEHGTGRVMAPYVRRQYGDELYEVMRELKRLCDPRGVLNPGVLIDEDADAHLQNFKHPQPIEAEADRCVECGYCEPACPSKDLTLTPRQRIVVRRGIERAEAHGDHALARELEKDYDYDGVQTCAVDGMCVTACPVLINTGQLVKRLRREDQNPVLAAGWTAAAKAWGPVTRAGSVALTAADRVPVGLVKTATTVGRAVLGADTMPAYSADLPGGGLARGPRAGTIGSGTDAPVAVYLPACVNSMFGAAGDGIGVTEAFARLLDRAGRAGDRAGGHRGDVLQHAVDLEGLHRGPRCHEGPRGRRRTRGDRRRTPAGPQRRRELHRGVRAHLRGRRPAHHDRGCRGLRRSRGPAAARRVHPRRGLARAASDVLVHADGSEPGAAAGGGRRRDHDHDARRVGVLRVRRRPGDAASRTDRIGHGRRGGRGAHDRRRGACVVQPHVRDRHDPGDGRGVPARARAARGGHPALNGRRAALAARLDARGPSSGPGREWRPGQRAFLRRSDAFGAPPAGAWPRT